MSDFGGAFDILAKGGWVAYCLAGLSLILWYAIGYRYLLLSSDRLKSRPGAMLEAEDTGKKDILQPLVRSLRKILKECPRDQEMALGFQSAHFLQSLSIHRQTIRSIVMVAPLLGLLGTVIGMIETFDSLSDSALFSQSGGIAGGISQALITTQMGLVVAIPGLLIGRRLDRKEEELNDCLDQMLNHIRLKKESHATE